MKITWIRPLETYMHPTLIPQVHLNVILFQNVGYSSLLENRRTFDHQIQWVSSICLTTLQVWVNLICLTTLQVEFKEGSLQPPAIKSTIDLPKKVDILGQQIDLSPVGGIVQQSLNPLQEAVASIARAISGQPPLKIPIPSGRDKSWLLITYLDKDFRISRGDGGLFVLAKEGSPLLDQWPGTSTWIGIQKVYIYLKLSTCGVGIFVFVVLYTQRIYPFLV